VRPISKITRAKRAGGLAQVGEHLPHKCKALSLNPSTNPTPLPTPPPQKKRKRKRMLTLPGTSISIEVKKKKKTWLELPRNCNSNEGSPIWRQAHEEWISQYISVRQKHLEG
jgi:phage portal protein BeeE